MIHCNYCMSTELKKHTDDCEIGSVLTDFRKPTHIKKMDQTQLFVKFVDLTTKMFQIIKAKNQDYSGPGEAFTNFNQIELMTKGVVSREMGTVVRMTDKLSRVILLLQGSGQVLDEKIEDTLLDLANYSLLLILMLEEKNAKHQKSDS